MHGHRLEPHRAVNRLVMAKACALVGALVAGGYAGYALTWLGMEAELADQRLLRSAIAAWPACWPVSQRSSSNARVESVPRTTTPNLTPWLPPTPDAGSAARA